MIVLFFFVFNARCSHVPETWICVLMDVLMSSLLGVGINALDDDSKITGTHLISMIFSIFFSWAYSTSTRPQLSIPTPGTAKIEDLFTKFVYHVNNSTKEKCHTTPIMKSHLLIYIISFLIKPIPLNLMNTCIPRPQLRRKHHLLPPRIARINQMLRRARSSNLINHRLLPSQVLLIYSPLHEHRHNSDQKAPAQSSAKACANHCCF